MGLGTAVFSAARAIVVINSETFGVVTSCNWSINYGVKEIREIDRVVARELAPSTYSVKFSLQGVKVMASNFDESGIVAAPGFNYLMPYISLAIVDRLTNLPLVNIEAGTVEELSYETSAKGIMTFNMSGMGFLAANDQSQLDQDSNPPKPPSPIK